MKFYQLCNSTTEKFLCLLLENYYDKGHRMVVRMENAEGIQSLDKTLWTFSRRAFVPHATQIDQNLDEQPIYLTDRAELPNNPDVLILTKYYEALPDNLAQIIFVFAANEEKAMKNLAQQYHDQKIDITYYCQNLEGKWDRLNVQELRN